VEYVPECEGLEIFSFLGGAEAHIILIQVTNIFINSTKFELDISNPFLPTPLKSAHLSYCDRWASDSI
jgi:hypothetical protein